MTLYNDNVIVLFTADCVYCTHTHSRRTMSCTHTVATLCTLAWLAHGSTRTQSLLSCTQSLVTDTVATVIIIRDRPGTTLLYTDCTPLFYSVTTVHPCSLLHNDCTPLLSTP